MHKEKLFRYGTLKDGDIGRALFGGIPASVPDELTGFSKTTTLLGAVHYPNIVPTSGGKVAGDVIEVDEETLRRVDEYESEAYKRLRMRLASGQQAWVYIRE